MHHTALEVLWIDVQLIFHFKKNEQKRIKKEKNKKLYMTCLSPNSRLTVSNELVNTAENLVMTKKDILFDRPKTETGL